MVEIEDEFGDLFFSLVNLARHYRVNSDLALRKTNKKFSSRFKYIEEKLSEKDLDIAEQSLEKLDQLWEEAKKDRKSTRLNSSHVAISYAVFCLKKKKKNNNK